MRHLAAQIVGGLSPTVPVTQRHTLVIGITSRPTFDPGIKGGARRAARRDQESGGVVAVHFDALAQLLIEAEAHVFVPKPSTRSPA